MAMFLCSCAVTSRLDSRQTGADVKFIPREIVTQTKERVKPYLEIKKDSSTYYLVPATTDENGEQMMLLDVGEVVIVAKSRSLPERRGKVGIDFMITLPKDLQGSCQSVVITPYLHKGSTTEPLQELSIRGGLFSKVQGRNYWQFEHYVKKYKPNATEQQRAFERFVKYPYPEGVRLDSIVESNSAITYYYNQEVSTEGEGRKLLITLDGRVNGLDGSYYQLPPSDTLQYNISSMLNFLDKTPRYIKRIIEKYAVVNDRNYLTFAVANSTIVDTLGNNKQQLERIESLMDSLVNQYEFHIDSIILTSSSSPEGSYSLNSALSKSRALSLKERLVERFGSDVDTLITVRSVAEDWQELSRLLQRSQINNRDRILKIIDSVEDPDSRELAIAMKYPDEYKRMREELFPMLRSVSFKYDLRRVGMLKDTIHTTELDTTYLKGMELLEKRRYSDALMILNGYEDHNSAVALMSLGYDEKAYEIFCDLPQNYMTYYLRAVLCSRLGYIKEGRKHFLESCNLNSRMEYRGKLDPEINNLLKDD